MKPILALPLVALLMLPLTAYATTGAGSATGNVTISGTCGISLNATSISYGTLAPNTDANATNNVSVTNTGSVTAALAVSGGNWTSGVTKEIYANETFVSTSPVHVSQMTPAGPHLNLNGSPIPITNTLGAGSSIATYWALITKLVGTFAGNLSQTVTYTTSC